MKNRRLAVSFACAIDGIIYGFLSQRNMKIHALAALTAITAAGFLGLSRWEWGLLMITIFLVLIMETINTAIEKTVDLATGDYHPLARQAKNLAAGAVLLSAVNAVIVGIIIFGPHIVKYLG